MIHLMTARAYLSLYKATGESHYRMKAINQLCLARQTVRRLKEDKAMLKFLERVNKAA